jgi:Ca2+-binding EF-hand superfamily protein
MQRTDPVLDDIRATFDRIDENGNGSIEFEEFTGLMLKLDHTRASSDLRAQFDAIDTNRDGRVSFDEFHRWCSIGR